LSFNVRALLGEGIYSHILSVHLRQLALLKLYAIFLMLINK